MIYAGLINEKIINGKIKTTNNDEIINTKIRYKRYKKLDCVQKRRRKKKENSIYITLTCSIQFP